MLRGLSCKANKLSQVLPVITSPVQHTAHFRHILRLGSLSSSDTSSMQVDIQGPGSESLRKQSCGGACSKDTPLLTTEQLQQHLPCLPAWQLVDDGKRLCRQFVARNFVEAMKFLDGVAQVAETEGHHPDLHLTEYRHVKVEVWTHAIGGLSMHDVVLASKVDAVPVEYSKKWVEANQRLVASSAS